MFFFNKYMKNILKVVKLHSLSVLVLYSASQGSQSDRIKIAIASHRCPFLRIASQKIALLLLEIIASQSQSQNFCDFFAIFHYNFNKLWPGILTFWFWNYQFLARIIREPSVVYVVLFVKSLSLAVPTLLTLKISLLNINRLSGI